MGFYSKQPVKVLMVWCRKIESVTIHRIVKSIDEGAFITQCNVNGVYGKGFDTMRVKMKKNNDGEVIPRDEEPKSPLPEKKLSEIDEK